MALQPARAASLLLPGQEATWAALVRADSSAARAALPAALQERSRGVPVAVPRAMAARPQSVAAGPTPAAGRAAAAHTPAEAAVARVAEVAAAAA